MSDPDGPYTAALQEKATASWELGRTGAWRARLGLLREAIDDLIYAVDENNPEAATEAVAALAPLLAWAVVGMALAESEWAEAAAADELVTGPPAGLPQ